MHVNGVSLLLTLDVYLQPMMTKLISTKHTMVNKQDFAC